MPVNLILSAVSLAADENGSTLRSLYYPPVNSGEAKEGQLRCGEHSDYGTITLLFQSSEGLQVIILTSPPLWMLGNCYKTNVPPLLQATSGSCFHFLCCHVKSYNATCYFTENRTFLALNQIKTPLPALRPERTVRYHIENVALNEQSAFSY